MSEAPYAPAEPPADGDRTSQVPPPGAPRYSASASVPVPPANNPPSYGTAGPSGAFGQVPPPQPTTYGQGNTYGQGSTYGQGATYGQPASQAPMGQAPMGQMGQPAMGQPNPAQANPAQPGPVWSGAGAAASGSYAPAPAAPATYGAASPGYQAQAQPGVYGQQQGGTQYGQPQPAGQFGQAQPPAGGQYGQPQGGGQFGQPQQGGQYGQPQTPPAFQPAPAQPQAYGQPQYGAPQQPPQQGRDKMVPTGGWPYVEQSEVPPAPKSRKGLTIFLIILAVLVVAGVGGYVGLRLANRSDVFVEGACVRQDGNGAEAVECGASGAYKITRIVETEDDCPDPTQPSLLLSDGDRSRVACLGPATP